MENSFDSYFDKLDKINEIVKSVKKCCDKKENHIIDDGMITCKDCNMIINNIMDSPEWRNYKDSSNNPTRCGMPTNALLPQSSLGTNISNRGGNEKMNKVNMYQKWNSMPYKERSLYKVYKDIELKCIDNDLPIIISNTAKSFYKIISETKISRGSNRIGIIAACIYYACKECNVPRSTSELASLFDINTKVMTKGCKNFTEIMRMSNCDKNRIQSHRSINLYDFVERFCHKLKFNENNILHIKKIAEICEQLSLINDNTPPAMSSGCIYLYIKNKNIDISKKHISDICKISEVTINKCSKKIENIKEINDYLNSI
tara:strand:- start:3064 stop:4011 length:948 start_codon:yes stop_codon:yes gene_type:complete